MKFEIRYKIIPEGVFGVPQEGMTVYPTTGEQIFSDTIHSRSGKKAGYGTLSKYRSEDEKLVNSFSFMDCEFIFNDNFLLIKTVEKQPLEAYAKSLLAINFYIKNLNVNQGRLFSAEPIYIESENGDTFEVPKSTQIASMTTYDLKKLKEDITEIVKYDKLFEPRLIQSLNYFEHALLLFEKRNVIADFVSEHNKIFISSIFLNIWKCVTTIVGDPSRKADKYQKRYREIGLEKDFKKEIDSLKELRDNYDVAHYSLNPNSLNEVEKNYGIAVKIAIKVIKKYREYLDNNRNAHNKQINRTP